MQTKVKKRLIRLCLVVLTLFVLFMAYNLGELHRVAFKIATAAGIEWGESAPQAIRVYFPRWACGPGQPPYLLVETGLAETAPLIGTHIRIEKVGKHGVDFGEHHFGECRGRFKNSLAMLIWEHRIIRVDGWCDKDSTVTGRFFDAEHCEALEPSLEQTMKINELMKTYQEPE